MSAIIAA